MKRIEPIVWASSLFFLAALVVGEGALRARLERRIPLSAPELYRTLAHSQTGVQVVDVRPDAAAGYEDAHIPGALPMPGCDLARTPEAARDHIYPSVPTVIVTAGGDGGEVRRCLSIFASARVLAGGMMAGDDENLPVDSGPYNPPSARAGGGCL